jgi:hypothetical protein
MDVASANPARGHADENFSGTCCWLRKIGKFKMPVFRKQKNFHGRIQRDFSFRA